jgi:hypothetical protein
MRAKLINEDFKEQSDPIEDMGIGTCRENVNKLQIKLSEMWDENYQVMLDEDGRDDRGQALNTIEDVQNLINEIFGKE